MTQKQYAERDAMALDKAGGHYGRHVQAMTAEKLHDKSDIAAELGYRDMQIAELQQQVSALAAENDQLRKWLISDTMTHIDETAFASTDAYLNSVRAEGIHFAANRMLAAWESGFIDDTLAQVHDISGAVLSALEFLPNASPGEFKRDYADEVRSAIAAQLRAGEQGGENV